MKKALLMLLALAGLTAVYAGEPLVLKLYPDGVGQSNGITEAERVDERMFIRNITEPAVTVYLPDADKATGMAVVVCPGGGYSGVSWNNEGLTVAEWLNARGIAAVLLKYRLPNGHSEIPLADALTAMELVRGHAVEWGIDKDKVGVMGFSAGGHLAASVLTHNTSAANRPDFGVLVYPVITMSRELTHMGSRNNLIGKEYPDGGEQELRFSAERNVDPARTPPTFIVFAYDDRTVDVRNGLMFATALKEKGIPAELHVYPTGGHGWGFDPANTRFPYRGEFYMNLTRWLGER